MNARRVLLAGAAVLILSSAPARADLSMGEMSEAVSEGVESWFEELYDSICSWLLQPQEGLTALLASIIPQLFQGTHLDDTPTAPEPIMDYVDQMVADRQTRVDATDATAVAGELAADTSMTTLLALDALNLAGPISVVAALQIGNASTIETGKVAATTNKLLASQMALEADRAFREEQGRQVAMAQYNAWADPIEGGGVRAVRFDMPW